MRNRSGASGNILFLILLAVVLFAALSYAVTQSLRGDKDAKSEAGTASAGELLNYFAEMSGAVTRMTLTGGVKDYEIDFWQDTNSKFVYGNYCNDNGYADPGSPNPTSGTCTTLGQTARAKQCKIYDPLGGGVKGKDLTPFLKANANSSTRAARIMYMSVPGVGTEKPDIVFTIEAVSDEVCNGINAQFGYKGVILNIIMPTSGSAIAYQSDLFSGDIANLNQNAGNIPAQAISAGTFCACNVSTKAQCDADAHKPMVYHILVAR